MGCQRAWLAVFIGCPQRPTQVAHEAVGDAVLTVTTARQVEWARMRNYCPIVRKSPRYQSLQKREETRAESPERSRAQADRSGRCHLKTIQEASLEVAEASK